jgi:hypothetical protein
MCYAQIVQALIAGGTSYAASKASQPGKMEITPAAEQTDIGDATSKSDLATEQLKKRGLRSTILAGSEGNQSSGGGNTLLGGG